ncbi:MAG: SAV_2336 N-terminal domain-related protein [Elainellaceae cyanobacterium]
MAIPGESGVSKYPSDELIKLLVKEQKFTSIEIAETLWLALRIEPTATITPDEPKASESITSVSSSETTVADLDNALPPPPAPPEPRANIATPTTPRAGVLPTQALPVWLADPGMLTNPLDIIRSLKPLLRPRDAGIGRKLNEPATVNRIARTQLWVPILEPEQEPWFDIILVVDRGSSMHIWQRLVDELVRILRRYGAFRDVQAFDIEINRGAQKADDQILLRSHPDRPVHRPSELIDQRGQRIAILLSDCAGTYWWDGKLLPMLQDWGKVMPTVIWQMLPEWMWERTALGRGTTIALRNDIPGAANQQLKTRVLKRKPPENVDQRVSMPVVTSEVRDLSNWSRMLAGDRREATPGFLLPLQGGSIPKSKSIEELAYDRAEQLKLETDDGVSEAAIHQEIAAIARERVQRFRELASPPARRLVMLLAASPVITLPVMRLIRDSMLYEARSPLPVAEVFLSGLLQRLPEQNDIELDLVQYDFVPKVRDVLLEVLPKVDTIEVINSITAAVEKRWNQFSKHDFRAFLLNPSVQAPEELEGLRSFASITADILEQLGGKYADFAQQLRYGAGEELPKESDEEEPDDFPLEDLEYEVAEFVNFPPLQPYEYQSATITAILDRFDFETATIAKENRSSTSRQDWTIQRRQAATWGYTETLTTEMGEDIGLDMIAIPGGSFMMGAPTTEPESLDSERPQHEVTLQPFYMGRYPVTQAQWRIVAGYPEVERSLDPDPSNFKGDNRPVEQVSWDDAQEFCKRLSAATGQEYRLPSEAEWEYACRAGTETPFYFGETITSELASYDGQSTYNDGPKGKNRRKTTEVGNFPSNDWGLHDMHGNVWEWCEDDWHSNYGRAPADGSAWVEADRKGTGRLLRGGSWYDFPGICRSAFRDYGSRDTRYFGFGFRVCCVPPGILSS